jgi:hypothetical protein
LYCASTEKSIVLVLVKKKRQYIDNILFPSPAYIATYITL